MIDIRPDPAHPRGGFAELTLAADKVPGETAEVSVYDNYSERFLGEAGWQATRVAFGPYAVARDGENARLVIGPEIVNQIEEYANVRLHVGEVSHDISWPDEIVPAPGAAKIGGIASAKADQEAPVAPMAPRMPEPEPDPGAQDVQAEAEEPEEDGVEDPDGAEEYAADPEPEKKSGKTGLWIQLIAFLLIIAAAAYWFFVYEAGPEPTPEPVPAPEPEPIPEPEPLKPEKKDTCTLDALRSLDGFVAQASALRDCGGGASADTALSLLEQAAAQGDPEALRMFGEIYDSEVTDEQIEGTIGLTFSDNPATAADYYARAVEAGSEQAQENLRNLCTRLETMTDTLAQGAFADHCGS